MNLFFNARKHFNRINKVAPETIPIAKCNNWPINAAQYCVAKITST
jgi:hypothetical protein